jgi:hypothetical protein
MESALGDLPVVGILRQCAHTATGWRGVDEAGVVIEVRSWEQARGQRFQLQPPLRASPNTPKAMPPGNGSPFRRSQRPDFLVHVNSPWVRRLGQACRDRRLEISASLSLSLLIGVQSP